VAVERGVALAGLSGSGPGGRIVKADVLLAAESANGSARDAHGPNRDRARGASEHVPLSRLQQTVARRMAQSRATVPDFELQADVDMAACAELRARLKELADMVPSYNDMVIKACALALREYPRANGSYDDGRFELHPRINIGVAVAAEDALLVPTVFDADSASLGSIAHTVRGLAERVRAGTITPPDLAGGTFTVSNLGMFGVDRFTAVINPPQAAILAVGAIRKRPAVLADGSLAARPLMTMTLAADHRILYGADAAKLLARIRELLERPLALAIL
jgi:pyruvate dehydrogenase E2 component (dihydrolipoamide acetyltransferase)